MVKIIDYKLSQNAEGKAFVSFKLQGGVEAIQSQQTGRFYLTAQTCYIATTFDEPTAQSMVGSELPGRVERIACDPYEYTVKDTGEVITLAHRYEYLPDRVPSASVARSENSMIDLLG